MIVRTDIGDTIDSAGNVLSTPIAHASLATLQMLQQRGAAVLVLGATPGTPGVKAPTLQGAAGRLGELLGTPVELLPLASSGRVELRPGQVTVLENLSRFRGESSGETAFVTRLADQGELYVNEAPRASVTGGASLEGLPKKRPSFAGLTLHRELEVVSELATRKHNPLVTILGGTDLAGSVALARRLMSGHNLKQIFIGGGIAYTFLRSRLVPIGRSLCDSALQVEAFQIIERSELSEVQLHLPQDHIIAERFAKDAKTKTVGRMDIPESWMALDVGPKTVSAIEKGLKKVGAVFWHGPLGAIELERCAKGTLAVAKAVSKAGGLSVAAGDSLVGFLHSNGYADRFGHLCQSSRLVLELLAGREVGAIKALSAR